MMEKINKYQRFPLSSKRRPGKLAVLIFAFVFGGYVLVSCSKPVETNQNANTSPAPAPSASPLVKIDPNLDFSAFKHSNEQHHRLPCSICHIRSDNSPTPVLPGHIPCASCHTEQFADKQNAICTICHKDPENGELKSFPGLKSFGVTFDHAVHLKQANCSDCHKSRQNGAAFSIPARGSAHSACFQCHKPETKIGDEMIGSCDACHTAGNPPRAVSESAKAFRMSFSHSNHQMNCTVCHSIRAGASRGNQVGAPRPAMHFAPKNIQSCATCHNNKRAFGGDDFSDCKRCHVGDTFRLRRMD